MPGTRLQIWVQIPVTRYVSTIVCLWAALGSRNAHNVNYQWSANTCYQLMHTPTWFIEIGSVSSCLCDLFKYFGCILTYDLSIELPRRMLTALIVICGQIAICAYIVAIIIKLVILTNNQHRQVVGINFYATLLFFFLIMHTVTLLITCRWRRGYWFWSQFSSFAGFNNISWCHGVGKESSRCNIWSHHYSWWINFWEQNCYFSICKP